MRFLPFLLPTTLACAPVAAQTLIAPDNGWQPSAPNAQTAQPRLGPNARAAQRPVGPNIALILKAQTREDGEIQYPSCSALGAKRAGPVRRGEPAYGRHLERDGNGVACDPAISR